MNKLFKNTTYSNLSEYETFQNFHNRQFGPSYHLYTFTILCVLCFLCITQFSYGSILYGLLFVIIILFFIFYRYFSQLFLIKKELNSGKISNESKNVFVFYERFFKVYHNKEITKMSYWKLHKIFETKTHFYLYVNKTYAFILNKEGFSLGTSDTFSDFIKRKCRFKYRDKRR